MNKFKHFTAAAILAGAIAAPALPALGSPASAAGPLFTGGIVNVTVTNVANNILRDANVGLGVAAGVAANVCDPEHRVYLVRETVPTLQRNPVLHHRRHPIGITQRRTPS